MSDQWWYWRLGAEALQGTKASLSTGRYVPPGVPFDLAFMGPYGSQSQAANNFPTGKTYWWWDRVQGKPLQGSLNQVAPLVAERETVGQVPGTSGEFGPFGDYFFGPYPDAQSATTVGKAVGPDPGSKLNNLPVIKQLSEGTADAIGTVGSAWGFLSWFTNPSNLLRLVYVAGGVVVVIVGLAVIAKDTSAGRAGIRRVAKGVLP